MRFRILLSIVVILLAAIFVFNRISDLKRANTRPPQSDQAALTELVAEPESRGRDPDDRANSQEREREGSSQYPVAEYDEVRLPSLQSTTETESSGRQVPAQAERTEAVSDNDNSPDVTRWIPQGWDLTGRAANSLVRELYRLDSDFEVVWDGSASASVSSLEAVESRTRGGILQIVDAQSFRGQRIKYSGFLRTQGLDPDNPALAAIWLRADDESGSVVAFQNTQRRLVSANTVWSEVTIIIDIPVTASTMHYGAYLAGNGSVWIDDFNIESVDLTHSVTAPPFNGQIINRLPYPRKVLESPTNLNFEFVVPSRDE
jgi:hypothetical protein